MPDLHRVDRKELFLQLVSLQDQGLSVHTSRSQMAQQYGVTVEDVVAIEAEGVRNQWPPLAAGP